MSGEKIYCQMYDILRQGRITADSVLNRAISGDMHGKIVRSGDLLVQVHDNSRKNFDLLFVAGFGLKPTKVHCLEVTRSGGFVSSLFIKSLQPRIYNPNESDVLWVSEDQDAATIPVHWVDRFAFLADQYVIALSLVLTGEPLNQIESLCQSWLDETNLRRFCGDVLF